VSSTTPLDSIAGSAQRVTRETVATTAPPKLAPKGVRWFREIGWRYVVGLIAVLFAVFPFLFVLSASLNRDDTLSGGGLIPSRFSFRHYKWLFQNSSAPYPSWLRNTLVLSVCTAAGTVLVCACGAFAFSRLRFKGRRPGLTALLLCQMFPAMLMTVALYLMSLRVNSVFPALGIGSLGWVIAVYLGGALAGNVWLTKSFFDTLPIELDESARVDGASHAQIFFRIILPLAAPILATIFIFSFIFVFNELPIAGALLRGDPNKFTLPYGLQQFVQGREQNWGRFAAGVIIAGVPVMLIFQFLQRFLVSGLTSGSVKG
jgi:arabinogalactan oligomer / maltooligosaccharide transport system permease protein